MATYESKTADEKANMATYLTGIYGILSSLSAMRREYDFTALEAFGVEFVAGPLSSLDPGELIPNPTGLGQGKPVTAAEAIALQARVRSIMARSEALETALVKAIGINSRGSN